MGKPDQTKRAKKMLTEAVTLLCRTNLSFSDQMTVEGLVGITLDRQDIILVSINETIKSGSGGSPSPSAKKKKSKKRRRRSTSSEDTEESDEDHGMMGHQGREFPMPGGSFPGVVGPDGQIHPVGAFHGEGYDDEHYGELDPADVEIKDEKFSEEEGECVMVEGEEDEDSKDAAFMKAHEMAYVQGNPAFNQVHTGMMYPFQAGPSNVRQFQGKAINQAQHQVQMTPPKVQQQMLKCHLCPKSFKWDKNLQKHLQDEHSGSKVHKCTWCDKVLSSDMSLKRHMKKVHGMNSDGEITCQECGKKITSLPCDFCAMMDYPDEEYDEFEEGELEIPIPLQNQQMMQQQHQQQMKFQMMPNQQPQQPQQFMVQGKRQTRMPLQQQQQQQQQGFINQQHQQFNPMMQQQQQFRQGAPQKFGQMPRRMAPQQQPQQQRMMMPRQPQQSGFQQQFQQHVQQRNPQQQQQQMPFRGQMMQQQPRQQMQMQRMKQQQQQQQQQPGSSPLYIKPEPEWEEGQPFPGQQQQVGQFNPQGQMQGQMPGQMPGQMQGQMQGQMGPMQGQQFNLPTGPQQGKKGQHKVQYVPPMQAQTMQSPKPDKSKNEEDNYEEEEEEEPKRKKKKKSKSKKRTPSGAESPSSQQLQPPPPPPPKSNTPKPTDNGSGQEKTAAAPEGAGSAGGAEGSQDLDDMETYIKEEPEWEEAHAH